MTWVQCSRCFCAPCICGQSIGSSNCLTGLYGSPTPAPPYTVDAILREATDNVLATLHEKIPGELKRRVDDLRKREAETQKAYERVAYPPPKGEP